MAKAAYRRILLKLSGESLRGDRDDIIDHLSCERIGDAICGMQKLEIQLGIVIGGGNIVRGSQLANFGFAKTPSDQIGMLATVINGLILARVLANKGCAVHLVSALDLGGIVPLRDWSYTLRSLAEGGIVIFVGGTGNPCLTTDTAAAVRASEIDAELLLKATKVDGIYDRDPKKYANSTKRAFLTFDEVLMQNLEIMDQPAVALCRKNRIPIHVVNYSSPSAMRDAVCEGKGGTFVSEREI